MARLFRLITFIFTLLIFLSYSSGVVKAADDCSTTGINVVADPKVVYDEVTPSVNITVSGNRPSYIIRVRCGVAGQSCNTFIVRAERTVTSGQPVQINETGALQVGDLAGANVTSMAVYVYNAQTNQEICVARNVYEIRKSSSIPPSCNMTVSANTNASGEHGCVDSNTQYLDIISNNVTDGGKPANSTLISDYALKMDNRIDTWAVPVKNGVLDVDYVISGVNYGSHTITLVHNGKNVCSTTFPKVDACKPGQTTIKVSSPVNDGPPLKINPDTCDANGKPGVKNRPRLYSL